MLKGLGGGMGDMMGYHEASPKNAGTECNI